LANPDPVYAALGWEPVENPVGRVPFILRGRRCAIDPMFVPLWTEIEAALDFTGYENPCDWIGTHKYRVVAGTSQLSRHSYTPGIAFDLDYGGDTDGDGDPTIDKNPHLHRKIVESDYGNTIQLLRKDVDAILSIKTVSGKQALRWLGDINGDSMHFDCVVSPEDIMSGIVPFVGDGNEEEETMDTPTWAKTLRVVDIDQMVEVGILTPQERVYWANAVGSQDPDWPEWQDLRNAYDVRLPLWSAPIN